MPKMPMPRVATDTRNVTTCARVFSTNIAWVLMSGMLASRGKSTSPVSSSELWKEVPIFSRRMLRPNPAPNAVTNPMAKMSLRSGLIGLVGSNKLKGFGLLLPFHIF